MTPLVLVPGLMCDARLYAPQIAAFSGRRAVHVAAIDAADTVAALAREALDHAPPRFALAGLSMGAIVAMEMLARAPERIERIALLDTNAKAESEKVRALREPQIALAAAGDLAEVMRREMRPEFLADGPRREEILDLVMEMALGLGPETFIRQSRALQTRPDQQETLRACRVPTLALCGAEDRLCPVHRHEAIRDLVPGARLEVIEGAGHLPTLERPGETTAALARWLDA